MNSREILPQQDYKTIEGLFLTEVLRNGSTDFYYDYDTVAVKIYAATVKGDKSILFGQINTENSKFERKFKKLTNTILRAMFYNNRIQFTLEIVNK